MVARGVHGTTRGVHGTTGGVLVTTRGVCGTDGLSGGRTRGCQGRPHLPLPWQHEAAWGPGDAALACAISFYTDIAKMWVFLSCVG